jgi:hypothetical protein
MNMDMRTFKQCYLERRRQCKIAWIPENFAEPNRILRIKDEEGWVVKEVYGSKRIPFDEAYDMSGWFTECW